MGSLKFVIALMLIIVLFQETVEFTISFKKGSPFIKLGTEGGTLRGKIGFSRDGRPFYSFIGIKYGHIKERFFEASLETSNWSGVKDAIDKGTICPQAPVTPRPDGKTTIGEEDCLNLNIYIPMATAPDSKNLPVLVWIHGGAFMWGEGFHYSPNFFMDEDVILVTINYRLGVFGFLSTGDAVIPGNNGLKDAVVALQWIQNNINYFAGDAKSVTIFGESAGGSMTHYLMLSPDTNGLFHRVISQSGTALLGTHTYRPNPKNLAAELANFMKCPSKAKDPSLITSTEISECLIKASMDELNEAQNKFRGDKNFPKGYPGLPFVPVAEDKSVTNPFLTDSPFNILTGKRKAQKIPWMIGMTVEECADWVEMYLANEDLLKEMDLKWEEIAPKAFGYVGMFEKDEELIISRRLRRFYFDAEKISKESRKEIVEIFSDAIFHFGIFKAAKDSVRNEVEAKVYLYQLAYQGPPGVFGMMFPPSPEGEKKVAHFEDISYLFDTWQMLRDFGLGDGRTSLIKKESEDEEFSKKLVKLWVSFARDGEPTSIWEGYDKKWIPLDKNELDVGIPLRFFQIDKKPVVIPNPYQERMKFWDGLYEAHFSKIFTLGNNCSVFLEHEEL